MFNELLTKPVLVGLHLVFGIIGIDAFFWLIGEFAAGAKNRLRLRLSAVIGTAAFILSWVVGGYYYVKYYGTLVKPVIKAGSAPWAHSIVMEAKEHIFLFIIPLAITAAFIAFLNQDEIADSSVRKAGIFLAGTIVFLTLAIGLMGYVISAAARWA